MPRCNHCKQKFEQYEFNNKYCKEIDCQTAKAMDNLKKMKLQKEKAWKKEKKDRKDKLQTVQDLVKIAQAAFNTYIRERDRGKNCISCGKPLPEFFDAGHYFSAGGHWAVRFNEDNCHGQHSRPCNKDLSGDLIRYRKGLIKRIGLDRLETLETLSNQQANYTKEELKIIIKTYRDKVKQLKQKS